jgi:aldehyde dehydrogenase (NAD+)
MDMTVIRDYKKLFIGGKWLEPANGEMIEVRSPHDQSLVGHAAVASAKDIDLAVAAARKAFDEGPWPRMSPAERREVIARFDMLHAARIDEIADLISAENGSARWFTGWTLGALTVQTGAFLKASEKLAWEENVSSDEQRTALVL